MKFTQLNPKNTQQQSNLSLLEFSFCPKHLLVLEI
jgi:hypothetical protein